MPPTENRRRFDSGMAEAWSFNARLQPCQIQVKNRQSQAVLAGFELYYGNEAAACGASTVTTNNGNVQRQKILVARKYSVRRYAASFSSLYS